MKSDNLLRLAYWGAQQSRDLSTQNGAILYLPTEGSPWSGEPIMETLDWNRFPVGVQESSERMVRPLKYEVTAHSEESSIIRAARMGIATNGLAMACPWAACATCARMIIDSGITHVLTHATAFLEDQTRWEGSIDIAADMLHEAGVEIKYWVGNLGVAPIRHSGELINP